jgi:hypothetical protein
LDWPAGATAQVVTGLIPTDDSRVLLPVLTINTGEQHPACPACWS